MGSERPRPGCGGAPGAGSSGADVPSSDRRARYARFEDVDWSAWAPAQRATLVFLVRAGRVLLIHKKRGLGAGKINGPGGRVADGESPAECAVREVREELGVTAKGVAPCGEIWFQQTDGYSLRIHVFRASDCEGEPVETDEAVPLWVPLERIPYEEMWADDRLWLPLLLEGRRFRARVLFDGDRLLGHAVAAETPR